MSAANVPVAILVRVFTNKQETARQVNELQAVAQEKGWNVIEVLEEHGVNRRAAASERHGLARAEELAAEGKIRKLLVHEVYRVGAPPSCIHALKVFTPAAFPFTGTRNGWKPCCPTADEAKPLEKCWRSLPRWRTPKLKPYRSG